MAGSTGPTAAAASTAAAGMRMKPWIAEELDAVHEARRGDHGRMLYYFQVGR
jgi:hypothetical protein